MNICAKLIKFYNFTIKITQVINKNNEKNLYCFVFEKVKARSNCWIRKKV